MSSPIVFFDIAGPEDSKIKDFYSDVFGWKLDSLGNFLTSVVSPSESSQTLMAAIRNDPSEKVIYIGVESVSDTLNKIVEKGGKIDTSRFEVPGVVVLGLFMDPAGNRMGLVELENNNVKVP